MILFLNYLGPDSFCYPIICQCNNSMKKFNFFSSEMLFRHLRNTNIFDSPSLTKTLIGACSSEFRLRKIKWFFKPSKGSNLKSLTLIQESYHVPAISRMYNLSLNIKKVFSGARFELQYCACESCCRRKISSNFSSGYKRKGNYCGKSEKNIRFRKH